MRFSGFSHLLDYQAEHRPEKTAFYYEGKDGIETLSYAGFRRCVLDRADALKKDSAHCEGIVCTSSIDTIIEIFAANLSGKQIVLFDANITAEKLSQLIGHTDVDSLYADETMQEKMKSYLCHNTESLPGRILFFTSGTTSSSKAVVLSDASLMSSAYNGSALLPLKEDDNLLCIMPLSHVFGFVCAMLWGLSCGAAVSIGRGMRHYFDDCSYFKPTAVSLVPMLFGMLLKNRLFNPECRLVLIGAGECRSELLESAKQTGLTVAFGYGLSETSSGVALSLGTGDPLAMTICPDAKITIAEDGEILIQDDPCMMEGYYKMPAETEEVLKAGVLYTGDLGVIDAEGKLHITGRKKEILVLESGTKIFLPEYEGELRSVLGEAEFIIAMKNNKPVLVVRGKEEQKEELFQAILPVVKKHERSAQITDVIMISHEFPKTASGKIQRWILQKEIDE